MFSSALTPDNDLVEGLYQSAISVSPPAFGAPQLLRAGAAPGPVAVDARGNVFALMDDQVIFMFADGVAPNATLVSEEPGVIWLSAWSAPDASNGLLLVHYQNRVDAAAYTIEANALVVQPPTPLLLGVEGSQVGLDSDRRIWLNTGKRFHILLPAEP